MPSSVPFKPAEAWRPADVQWNSKWAAHLYRRAAFGFPPRSFPTGDQPHGSVDGKFTPWRALQQAVGRDRDECVDELLSGGEGQGPFNQLLDSTGEQIARIKVSAFQTPQTEKLQGWWLARMLYTPHPLLERVTLFWHDHFATSLAKVTNWEMMFRQHQLLRRHALGKFPSMLAGISRDPAMLFYLDSNSNIKGRPNENFAREIMELFSLGVGNYTEKDIREAARAFTGWGTADGEFLFNAALHDGGEKTVLGKTGPLDGDDIVGIILKQPAVARFLVAKLYREFVSEVEPPPPELLEPLAESFRQSGYDIKACLRTIFRSRIFNSDYAYRSRIKSPVEYAVGLTTALEAQISPEQLAKAMEGLGQALFAPPNVAGWDGGEAWLNSATLLARHNLAAKLLGGKDNSFRKIDPAKLAEQYAGKEPAKQAEFFMALFLENNLADEARRRLLEFAAADKPKDQNRRMREVAHTIVLLPEYQLA